jgi:hypothetical protein
MKRLMTATALTLSLGIAAPAMAQDAVNEAVPSERQQFMIDMNTEMQKFEEELETMDVDPRIRDSWVKLQSDWNTVTDEPAAEDFDQARADFEDAFADFSEEWQDAKTSGLASNSAVPEERRTFEQSTSYDLARAEVGMYQVDQNQGLDMSVKQAWKEARSDWYAMLQASGEDWAEARAQYLESWAEFQQAWMDAQSSS